MVNEKGQRELCYVVKIDNIEPIVGSDNCEAAIVGGWKVMVRKNTFKVGDYAIYFEIDSKLPETYWSEFLKSKHYKVKTQKFTFGGKGCFYSQGLLMSFDDFGIHGGNLSIIIELAMRANMGVDISKTFLTKELGVTYAVKEDNKRKSNVSKYEKMYMRKLELFKEYPILKKIYKNFLGKRILYLFLGRKSDSKSGWPVGRFPGVSKTDQERIENMVWVLTDKTPFIKTLKVDGTSTTFILEKKDKKFEEYVCSRNVRMFNENQNNYHSENENVYWQVYKKYKIREFLENYIKEKKVKWVCLQGETAGCSESGVKIQGDPNKLNDLKFYGFHLTDSENGRIDIATAAQCCQKAGIDWVPIIDDNYILPDELEIFKKEADGECEIGSGLREGYVYYKKTDPTFSFKNISREYLLKHNQ